MTAAGKLRRRVTIQEPEVTIGATGGEVTTWADLATVWANIKPLSGQELLAARQSVATALVSTQIEIRYRSDVNSKMRVAHGSQQTYEIVAVLPDERQTFTKLLCRGLV